MRPIQIITGATGASVWTEVDTQQKAFAVGFLCTVGGATSPSMTYKVQHAFSNKVADTACKLTRSGTTATLVFNAAEDFDGNAWVNHGLSTSDNLWIVGAGAPFDSTGPTGSNSNTGYGIPVASVTDNRTVTFTVANSGNTVANAGFKVLRLFVNDHPIVTAQTGTTAGNYAYPINYVRTNITAYTSGSLTFTLNQGV